MEETSALADLNALTGLPKGSPGSAKSSASNDIAALTGTIPSVNTKSPFREGESALDNSRRTIDLTNVYTDPIENYVSYGVPLNPYADWNDIRAKNQSTAQKIGRGALKMLTTTTGAVAENTIGIIGGLASLATGGTYADNAVGRSIDDMNDWMSTNLPHYYTNKELEPGRDISLNANFWTDKVANGLGYSLGSLATVWLTGGEGLLAKGMGAGFKAAAAAAKIGGTAKALATGEKLRKIYEISKMVKTGAKLEGQFQKFAGAARFINATKHIEMGAMMSLAEASVEAREKSKMFREEMISDWEESNPGQQITEEARNAIEQSAKALENTTFGLNMAVLMPTNLLMFGKSVLGAGGRKAMTNQLVKDGEVMVEASAKTGFGKAFAKANNFAKPIYENSITEAYQEGAQFLIGDAGIDYYKNKFDSGIADMSGSFVKGLENTFGTTEGLESMLLGAITGGAMGGASTAFGSESKQRKEMKANTEKLAAIMNSGSFTDIFTDAKEKNELLQTITGMNAAQEMGNFKLADEFRNNVYAIRAMQLQRLGAMDMGIAQLDDLAQMDEKTFMERGNYNMNIPLLDQTGGKTQGQVVEEAKDRLKQMAKISDSVDEIINVINPQKSGLPGLLQGKEGRKQAAMQNMYNQQLKSILMTKMVGIKQRDKEIQDSLDDMQSVVGDERYTTEAVANPFFGYSLSKLVTIIKRNKINVDESGNINFPDSLVDTSILDTDTLSKVEQAKEVSKLRKEKQEALDQVLLKYGAESEAGFNAEEYKKEAERVRDEYDTKIKSYDEESADKPISVERLGKKTKTKEDEKFLSILQQALEESENFDFVNKQKFQNGLVNVLRAVQAREEAVVAFDELLKSPEKREFTMAAKEAAAKAAAVDKANKQAEVITDNAETSADILEILNDPNLTPEKQAAARKKYEELKKIEDEYYKDYDQLDTETLEEIEKELEEGTEKIDAQKLLALRRLIAARKGLTLEEDERIADTIGNKKANSKEAEDAVNNVGPAEEEEPEEIKNAYVNKFAVRSPDGRRLRVNGVNYENTFLNPLDAIEKNGELADQEVEATEAEQIAKLADIKETVAAAESLTPLMMEKIFKTINPAEYEAWQQTVDPAKLQEDLKELLSVATSQEQVGTVLGKYLLPQFIDTKIAELTATAEENKDAPKPSIVKSVTLTNEQGQEVIFSGEVDQNLANELAEVIMVATASAGTISTIGISEVEAKAKAKIAYEALLRMQTNAAARTQVNENNATPATLSRAIKMYKDVMMETLTQLSLLKEAYLRQGMSGTEFNQDTDVQKFKDLFKDLKAEYSKYVTKLQNIAQMPTTAEPKIGPVGEMSEQEENEYETLRGLAQEQLDETNRTIIGKNKQLQALEAAINAGVENSEALDEIAAIKKELETLEQLKNWTQEELNRIQDDYERRKASKANPDVQAPEGSEGPVEEQANREETPGDVQVPEESESDVNDVPDSIIIGAEEIDNADFIEIEGEEDGDVFGMEDFQNVENEEEEEEDDEDFTFVGDTTERLNTAQAVDSPENGGQIGARLMKSQYEYEEGYDHVVVNNDGTIRPNVMFEDRRPKVISKETGKFEKLKFKPHLLANALISPIGTEISFEVRTDAKWYKEQLAAGNIPAGEEWKHVPITVVIRTPSGKLERVGMLERYSPNNVETNFNRQDIYNGFVSGKRVTSTIQGKRFSAAQNKKNQNIANAVTSDGEHFFYNPIATVNDLDYIPTIAIARTVKGLPKWQVALEGDAVGENESVDTSTFSVSTRELGSVAIIVKNPVGEFTHIKALTRILTPTAINSAIEGALQNDSARVGAIVGFNLVREGAINNENTDLIFQDTLNIGQGVTTYTFYVPSAESYIRISSDNLQLALQKEPFEYSFVEAKKGEKGGINFEIDSTRKDYKAFYEDITKSFRAAISKRRFQVDVNALAENGNVKFQSPVTGKVFESYLDYLTDDSNISDLSEDFNGHASILSVDAIFHPNTGSPFFDVGLTYGPMLIDGKAEQTIPTPARKASITPTPDPVTQEEEYEEDESEDEDDRDVDMSNMLFDEDEDEDDSEVVVEEGSDIEDEVEGVSDLSKLVAEVEESDESDDINFDVESPKDRKLSGTIAEEEEEETIVNPVVALLDEIETEGGEKVKMYKDPVSGEETHYIIDGKKFPRITRLTSEPFETKTEADRVRQKNSSQAGTAIHFVIIENVLRGKQPKKPTNITAGAFLDLMSQARAIKEKIAKDGIVIATERVVNNIDIKNGDDKIEYAGRLDILVKLKNGKYRIVDIKTGSEKSLEGYEKENVYTDPNTKITTTKKSKRQQHGSQLSALGYALKNVAIRNKSKVDVQDAKVYFIPIAMQEDGTVKKISKFVVKNFNLSFDIRKILKGELTFEQKIADSAVAPEVKSAGKSKSSTKTADKGETVTTPKKRKRELELGDDEVAPKKGKKAAAKDESETINVEGTFDDQVVAAVLQMDASAQTIQSLYKGQKKTITLEEAKKIKEKILEENC